MLLRLSWRSLWRNRRRTIITIVSITFGVALTAFVVAMSEGVYGKLIDEATRSQTGQVVLQHPEYLARPSVDLLVRDVAAWRERIGAIPEVEMTKVMVTGQCLVKSAQGAVGAALMGVEPEVETATSMMAKKIVSGRYLRRGDTAGIVIGVTMAERLKVKVGKKVVVTANNVSGDLVEELCRVRGVFRTASDEIDGYVVQVPISFSARLFGLPPDSASQVGAVLGDARSQDEVLSRVRSLAASRPSGSDPVAVLPWEKVLPEVAGYVTIDRAGGQIMEGLVMFLILFTIFNTILMSVLERQREFAVQIAIGTSPWLLRRQVAVEAAFINVIGCALGLLIGGAIAYYYEINGMNLEGLMGSKEMEVSGYAVSATIYPEVTVRRLAILGGVVLGITSLLSMWPAWRAPRVPVAEMVRAGK